ncbi:dihydrolipoyl dehydrogenase [Candidatus Woesearchaeota archaeon]|nr:dihydrolipoyl dehydrogenase [Candidatus Woesearchaeota archaeon]
MKKRHFDVLVIGAGSGLIISSYAAKQGLKVAVVEAGPFGGTCLNRGCIPSKMLIHSADVMQTIRSSSLFGIKSKVTGLNWKKIVSRVSKIVDSDAKEIEKGNKSERNITVFKGSAVFVGKREIEVNEERISADKVFVCAGSRPSIAKIPGLEKVPFLTSDEALRLKRQPKRLIIIGGGYISAELAHFFGSLGTKITIIQRGPLLMGNEDSDIAKKFTEVYRRKFNVLLNASTDSVAKKDKAIIVSYTVNGKKKNITGDALLIATGRVPNTDFLDVKAAGIKTDERGFINVNKFMETSAKNVWAIGDIAGKWMFKHSANLEAQSAIQNAFGKKIPVDYTAMPHAAFTSPQVASVGMTEDELKKKGIKYLKGHHKYIQTGYGAAIQDKDGFVKVLIDPKSRKILGCHILGTDASILIHEVIIAMKAGLTADQVANTVHVHPALSEVVQRAFNV